MKRITVFAIAFVFLAGTAGAQKFFARVGTGMSIKAASDYALLYNYDESNNVISNVPVGFGTGYHLNAAFGYMFQKYIGVEIGVTKFFGFKTTADSPYYYWYPGETNGESTMKGNMWYFTPAVIITPGLEKINPYARLGLNVGVASNIIETDSWTENSEIGTDSYEMTQKWTGGLAMGFNAAAGVDFKITDLITLYAELNFNGISWAPKKSEVTQYEINGVDDLGNWTVNEKETEYSKDLDLDANIPDTDPSQALLYNYPFSNAGCIVGIKFTF